MTLIADPEDVEVFRVWLRKQSRLAIDTETNVTELDHLRFLVGVSFYAPPGKPWYLPVGHTSPVIPVRNIDLWDFSKDLRKDAELVFHNAKFDLKILRKSGVDLFDWNITDTMLWHHLLDSYRPHKLADLERMLLKKDVKKDLVKKVKAASELYGMEGVIPQAMAIYAENDVMSTWELRELFQPMLESKELIPVWADPLNGDQSFMKLLAKIEEAGLRLDRPYAQRLATESKLRIRTIQDHLPFDPNKRTEVKARFFGEPPEGLGLSPSKYTPNGDASVGDETLAGINHPEAGLLREYRTLSKAVSTWFEGYPKKADLDGHLHPYFKQHGTLTYRLSAENPNPQQIPRDGNVKAMFLPEKDCDLVEFDYRAIEFRLAAVYGNVESLIAVFKRNGDIHESVASELGIQRYVAKNTNFCIIYGGGPGRIAETAGIPFKTARDIFERYRKLYPGLFAVSERCEELARKRGFVRYWDGRRRIFRTNYEHRKAFNSVVQGGAFQIIKRSMLQLDREGYDIRNQVHDSIWLNLPKGWSPEPIVSIMEDWTEDQFGLRFHVEWKLLHE